MKQTFYLLFALFSLTLAFSCSKSGGPTLPTVKELRITSIAPEKIYNGSKVTFTGENFGTDISEVTLILDTIKMTIDAVTNSTITFTIPTDFIHQGQRTFSMQLIVGTHIVSDKFTVYFPEPHGWYYASPLPLTTGGFNPIFKNLIFPTDSIGYALKEKYLYYTLDGGISWRNDLLAGSASLGNAIASTDGKNVWIESLSGVGVAHDGASYYYATDGRQSFGYLTIGLYTNGPSSGLIASADGKVWDVNGNFATANMMYQSKNYVNGTTQVWKKFSAVDKNNWMIAGSAKNIVYNKAGVITEADISAISNFSTPNNLQLVDPSTAFLVTDQDELLKYMYTSVWTKLTQKANAVCFVNANTGYIAYNNKILKSTDGGYTWNEEFTLKSTDKVAAICAKNGKVWAVGNGDKESFILKYNP